MIGKVPLHLGCTPQGAEVQNGRVHLSVRAADGSEREIVTEHVIAATGYRVDLERLKFLNARDSLEDQGRQWSAGALIELRVVDARSLFRGRCGREQLWTGHAVCVRCRLRRSHDHPRPDEVSLPGDGIGSGSERGDELEVNRLRRSRAAPCTVCEL